MSSTTRKLMLEALRAAPVSTRPEISVKRLKTVPLEIPCPPDGETKCEASKLLESAGGVGWLIDVLSAVADDDRTSSQYAMLGCAHAYRGSWKDALAAFEAGIEAKTPKTGRRVVAALVRNIEVARAALDADV